MNQDIAEEWPSVIRWELVNAARRCIALRIDAMQRQHYLSALDDAIDAVGILAILQREAKRLQDGDVSAADFIRDLMQSLAAEAPEPFWNTPQGLARVREAMASLETPSTFPPFPADGVINPIGILLVDRVVEISAGHDPSRRKAYTFALDWLWARSARLDSLSRHATGVQAVDAERFLALLRIEVRRRDQETGRPAVLPVSLHHDAGWLDDVLRGVLIGKITTQPAPLELAPDRIQAYPIFSVAPRQACAGEQLTVRGRRFGAARRPTLTVVLDTGDPDLGAIEMEVVTWSDTEIVVRVPQNARAGCIAIRDVEIDLEDLGRWKLRHKFLASINTARALQGRAELKLPPNVDSAYIRNRVPCTAANRFLGALPEIVRFETNGALIGANRPPAIAPGTRLVLSWQVGNADSVSIRRSSTEGPQLPIVSVANAGSRDLGPFIENRLVRATYSLTATNRCGTVGEHVHVLLRARPRLRVLGIEVSQAIQRFDPTGVGPRNDVPLVSRHRTVARVYLESGLSGGFVFGTQADKLPVAAAQLQFKTPAGQRMVPALNPGAQAVPAGAGVFERARLESLRHGSEGCVNFLLPWDMADGNADISVDVRCADGGPGTRASASTRVVFQRRRRFRVIFMPVADTLRNLPGPSHASFLETWRGAVARLPLAEDHWATYWYAPSLLMDHDLATRSGWSSLVHDLLVMFDVSDLDESWDLLIGLVNDHPAYTAPIAGKSFVGRGVNVALNRAGGFSNMCSLAHEVAHSFGIGHSSCSPDDPDPSLPCFIEQVGVDMETNGAVWGNMPDVMFTPAGTVPSVTLWERLFNLLP